MQSTQLSPSRQVKEMIKGFEGLSLTAYRCPAGCLTVGHGHTGADVSSGLTITPAQADRLFEADIAQASLRLQRLLRDIPSEALTQQRFDALLSLGYNIGMGALAGSTLLRKFRACPADPSVADEFLRWNKSRGRPLKGLSRRRHAERLIFISGQYPDLPKIC